MRTTFSLIVLGLFFLLAHVLMLPPQGWMTGDQGSKYLQARAFATQGPWNPAIQVASRDLDPQYVYQEPKLKNRRGRLVSEFLWLLPLLAAPFLRVLGLQGLYVVPALSVMAIFAAAAALGRRLGDDRGIRTAWTVLLITPVVLYGLEFWEHAPAAACVMIAAVLALPTLDRGAASRLIGAGAAIAAGALFREEVIVALPALLIARELSRPWPGLRTIVADGFWMALGGVGVLAASVPVNFMIYGAALPMHMTQDAWEVAKATPYLSVRRDIVTNLLLPANRVPEYLVAVLAGVTAALMQAWRLGTRRGTSADGISRGLLLVVHLSVIVALGVAVGQPVWRKIHGLRQQDCFNATSAAHMWPFWVAILYAPWHLAAAHRPAARFLIVSAALLLVGIGLVIPTDGGAQYSPRFLLAAAPFLAIVAASSLSARPWSGPGEPLALPERWQREVRGVVGVVLVASLVMQLAGVFLLRRAKMEMARLTASVARETGPDEVLFTNVYWVPEVMATLAPTRRMLFSWSAANAPAVAGLAARNGFRRFSIVTSRLLTGYEAPAVLDGGPCRFTRGTPVSLDFGLLLSHYSCRSGSDTGAFHTVEVVTPSQNGEK